MPYLFRTINKRRWDWGGNNPPWLPRGAVPGAPFGDVAPSSESVLSLWWVEQDESNVHRVVAALAAGRQHFDKFDYALIDEAAVRGLGIKVQAVAEPCPDQVASTRWHRNLIQLTADNLHALVSLIKARAKLNRLLGPEVKALVKDGLEAGHLERARINPALRESL